MGHNSVLIIRRVSLKRLVVWKKKYDFICICITEIKENGEKMFWWYNQNNRDSQRLTLCDLFWVYIYKRLCVCIFRKIFFHIFLSFSTLSLCFVLYQWQQSICDNNCKHWTPMILYLSNYKLDRKNCHSYIKWDCLYK